ncbi:MFS transporter [Arthrobacter sp. AK01]|uniref:MFS transporter n=1 Tax=Arthrobacter sp. AK01 TaxID=2894084 RepID=UPI001E4303FA|nr:MFS transporter [Arthrobacter sp. AK01]MCD4851092.1 MFS transporter [Arthrobacter sp. AK01]
MTTSTTAEPKQQRRLPRVVPLLAVGTFLMITTEYMVAGLLQEIAGDLNVSVAHVALLITAFAVGMILGSPVMALATLRLPRRATLVLALLVFAAGHVLAALTSDFGIVLLARVITALAAGAFWSIASVIATQAAGPANSSRALGVMMSGVGPAPVIARFTPEDTHTSAPSVRAEIRAVVTGRMVVLVLATVFATGGYMTAFSYLSPVATDRGAVPLWAVPLLFVVFGLGAVLGTNLAGRFADKRPVRTFISATGATVLLLGMLIPLSANAVALFVLMFLLGIAGMGIPPVATGLAATFAQGAPTLAAAVAVAAFNGGTAIGTWAGATALESALGGLGPLVVATIMASLGLLTLLVFARSKAMTPLNHRTRLDLSSLLRGRNG